MFRVSAFSFLSKIGGLTAVAAAATLVACGGSGSSASADGTLKLAMTDSPGCGYDHVYVTVNKIRIHPSASATDSDSGWRFFSGTETQEYVDNADNLEIFDCNTIANYDQDIIPLLLAPVGSAFERNPETGKFEAVDEE